MILKRWAALLIASLMLCTGCDALISHADVVPSQTEVRNDVAVHFIDVGQADAILVQSKEGDVLIDGGDTGTDQELIKYLRDQGVRELSYVVATHPHSDHIGGLPDVINEIPVNNIVMPDAVHTTKIFERLLDAVENNNVTVMQGIAGESFELGGLRFDIVAPNSDEYDDLNDYSVCINMSYGDVSFLFTGDAEKLSEGEMLDNGRNVSADVMKVGHHGSSTSTSREFIQAVNPSIAVISCGEDNSYGHPHKETLETLAGSNALVYRTDQQGTIVMTTDGVDITVSGG